MDRWTHFKEDILLSFYGIDAINLEVNFLNKAFRKQRIRGLSIPELLSICPQTAEKGILKPKNGGQTGEKFMPWGVHFTAIICPLGKDIAGSIYF